MNGPGKRAIEAGWKWMPGMSADGMLVVDADESGLWVVRKGAVQEHWAPEEALPDLTDPATLGCLLVQVSHLAQQEKEAAILRSLKQSCISPILEASLPVNDILNRALREISINGFTQPLLIGNFLLKALEAEALVAALEAAE